MDAGSPGAIVGAACIYSRPVDPANHFQFDLDGDGKADSAVFRQPGAQWFVNKSSGGVLSLSFGAEGDLAVPGAYVR